MTHDKLTKVDTFCKNNINKIIIKNNIIYNNIIVKINSNVKNPKRKKTFKYFATNHFIWTRFEIGLQIGIIHDVFRKSNYFWCFCCCYKAHFICFCNSCKLHFP